MSERVISIDSVVQQNREVVSSEIDGEVVMMSVEQGRYYSFDPIGSRIWALIEAPVRVGDLVTQLVDEFDVEPGDCERDVLDFLNALGAARILVAEPGKADAHV